VALFRDPSRGGVVLVTLAEDMPVSETLELHTALRDELAMPVHALVVNQVLPRLFSADERDVVRSLGEAVPASSPLATLARAGRGRVLREEVQEASLARLAAALPRLTRVELPMWSSPSFQRAAIESLSQAFGP